MRQADASTARMAFADLGPRRNPVPALNEWQPVRRIYTQRDDSDHLIPNVKECRHVL